MYLMYFAITMSIELPICSFHALHTICMFRPPTYTDQIFQVPRIDFSSYWPAYNDKLSLLLTIAVVVIIYKFHVVSLFHVPIFATFMSNARAYYVFSFIPSWVFYICSVL